MKYRSITKLIGGLAAAAVLSACGGGGSGDNTGTLSLSLTDAPADEIAEMVIFFDGATAKPKEGEQISWTFDEPLRVDLALLQDGESIDLIANRTVPAGEYNWVAGDAQLDGMHYVKFKSGEQIPLRIPSDRIRFVSGFVVTVDRLTHFMVDWDMRRAVAIRGNKEEANARPAFRVTDMAQYASIGGTVSSGLMDPDDTSVCPDLDPNTLEGRVVYLYPLMDHVTGTFDDIFVDETNEKGPIATAQVKWDADMINYEYQFHYVTAPKSYTLAFTCNASNDFPDIDEEDFEFQAFIDVIDLMDGEDQLDANFE
jgi:hypothetical protein